MQSSVRTPVRVAPVASSWTARSFCRRRPGCFAAGKVLHKRHRRETRSRLVAAVSRVVEEIEPATIDTRIPVTVISGYLGSGKTTLLNNVLTKDHGRRIAVIENEFGQIDIDSDLVKQKYKLDGTGDTIMVLNNGCLCCTVREDLVESLDALCKRRDEFDHIVIETTGLAKVGPIISTFYLDGNLPERVRLDGVVTVVDAKHIERHLDAKAPMNEPNEAVEQIAYADRIVINKTDLIDDNKLAELEVRVRDINTMATLSRTTHGDTSVDYVLGIGGFDAARVDQQVRAILKHAAHISAWLLQLLIPEEKDAHEHDHEGHDHHHHHHQGEDHHHHHHEDGITSVNIVIDGEVDLERVNTVMGAIVNFRGEDIFRMKGILAIRGWEERFVFQVQSRRLSPLVSFEVFVKGVHMIFEGIPDRLWMPHEERITKMVFIGKNLKQDDFETALNACRA